MLNLKKIQNILKQQAIDHFILPNSDEFFLEYLPENQKRIEYLTGFTGSNATIIVNQNNCKFFTDGRYILQARNQLNSSYEIFNIATDPLLSWIKLNIRKSELVAIDIKLFSINFVENLQKILKENGAEIAFLDYNLVDKIWENRPQAPLSEILFHDLKYSGKDSKLKRQQILSENKVDAIFFNSPESICWLLNIRALDVEFTPILATYAILFQDGKVDLFVNENRFNSAVKSKLENVNFIDPSFIESRIERLGESIKTIQVDLATTNFWIYSLLKKNLEIVAKADPVLIHKACKNEIEIAGAIEAHKIDGLAVTKFLFWLEREIANKANLDELQLEEKLLAFRKENPNFLYPSFASISSFAENGAIIHYRATKETNKKLEGNSLYLIDSGGQYFQGTTDVTRVVAFGEPSQEMIENYTLVLKGHIALAAATFPLGTSGMQLDSLARSPLKQCGKDYDHGTGHGVGSFLSVHEGPCAINKRNSQPLLQGMILSNEPGFYKENAYGIRIENLMLIDEFMEGYLNFRTLTIVPLDYKLINFEILSLFEKKWLKNYHQNIFDNYKNHLREPELSWLESILNIYKKIVDKEEK